MSSRWLYKICFLLVLFGASGIFSIDRTTLKWMRSEPVISKIFINGNFAYSSSEIKSQLYSKERSLWQKIKGSRGSRLRRETLNRDTLELKYLYLKDGYLGVKVSETFDLQVDGDDSSIVVTITITEGKRFTFGQSSIKGDYPAEWQFELEKSLKILKPGKPMNPFEIHQTTINMKGFLSGRGYPKANIENFVDTASFTDSCPVVFTISTDSLVRYGQIYVQGIDKFPDYVARRELKIKTGSIYRSIDITDSQRRLYESGYFTSFNLQIAPDSGTVYAPDYVLRVKERKPYFLTASTGPVGQSDVDDLLWSATFGFGKRNFLKTRQVSISADYFFSTGSNARLIRNIYSLKYTDPWFLGIRMPTTFGFNLKPKVRSEYVEEYDIARWSISVSTLRKFGRYSRTDFGFEYESVDISGIPPEEIPIIKQANGESERRKFHLAFRRDSREHLFIPKRGSVADLSFEYVGGFLGGDDNFFAVKGNWSRYHKVWPGWISATRIKGGWIKPFGNSSEVPADDRLYLGGANTVRGFVENSLGPLSGDSAATAIGARYTLLFNQEFRWKTVQIFAKLPLVGNFFKKFPFWQSVFVDIGNGFNAIEDIKLDNFAYAYGTGIQIISPAGPIRLDYARRIETKRYDFDYRWHFTILYAF